MRESWEAFFDGTPGGTPFYFQSFSFSDVIFLTTVVFRKNRIDLFRRGHYMGHGYIMIHEIDDGSHKLAHVRFCIVRALIQLRRLPGEIGRDYPVKPAFFVGVVKGIQAVGEQAEGTADEYTFCLHLLKLSRGIQHAFSGGNHIVDDDDVSALNIVAQELMGNDGIFSINDDGIVASLIEHTRVHAEHIAEIDGAVQRSFIRTDDSNMILIDDQIIFHIQKGTDELIGRSEVIKSVQRSRILHSGIVGIEGDEIIHTHISQFCEHIGTVQRFPAGSSVLASFIQEGHDDIDALCLSGGCRNHPFQILIVVIRGFVIGITVNGIGKTVIAYVHNNEQILSVNGLMNASLCLSTSKTGT